MLELVQNGLNKTNIKRSFVVLFLITLWFLFGYAYAYDNIASFISYKIRIIDNDTAEIQIKNLDNKTHHIDLMVKKENGFSAELKPGDSIYQKLKLPFNITKNDFAIMVDNKLTLTGSSIANREPNIPIQNIALVMLLLSSVFVGLALVTFYKFFRKISSEYHYYH